MFGEKFIGFVRHLVTALGASILGAKAAQYLTPDMIDTIAGAALMGLGFVLSWLAKKYPAIAPIIEAVQKVQEENKGKIV